MTTAKSWSRKGAYIPFPLPLKVDPIPALITDSPLWRLPVNENYVPYLAGAMKALARDETYTGDQDDIHDYVDQWRLAQTLFYQQDDINWHLHVVAAAGTTVMVTRIAAATPDYRVVYSIGAFDNGVGIDFTITGKTDLDDTTCGGLFKTVSFNDTDQGNVDWDMDYIDCYDTTHYNNHVGGAMGLTDIEAKQVRVQVADASVWIWGYVQIWNPYVCAEA